MGHLKLSPKDVVQVRSSCGQRLPPTKSFSELRKFFPDQMMPPVVFVEWLAAVPVEIEMIAQLSASQISPAEDVVYYTPPEVRPSNTFSKAVLLGGRPADLHLRPLRADAQPRRAAGRLPLRPIAGRS